MPRIIREGYVVDPQDKVEIPGELSLPRRPAALRENADASPDAPSSSNPEDGDAMEDYMANMVSERKREADGYMENARKEAEALLADAGRQAKELRTRAVFEGRAQGAAEKAVEIEECVQKVDDMMNAMQLSHTQFLTDYESELRDMALEIAGKVLSKRISEDDMVLSELVKKAVLSVRKAEWIQVEISEQLPMLMEYLRRELADSEYGGNVEVVAQAAPIDSCILQTPDGIVDASVSTQLNNLREQFGQVGQL